MKNLCITRRRFNSIRTRDLQIVFMPQQSLTITHSPFKKKHILHLMLESFYEIGVIQSRPRAIIPENELDYLPNYYYTLVWEKCQCGVKNAFPTEKVLPHPSDNYSPVNYANKLLIWRFFHQIPMLV